MAMSYTSNGLSIVQAGNARKEELREWIEKHRPTLAQLLHHRGLMLHQKDWDLLAGWWGQPQLSVHSKLGSMFCSNRAVGAL